MRGLTRVLRAPQLGRRYVHNVAIAYFDLDRTLLAANSGRVFLREEVALGHVSRVQALRAAAWLARYSLGFASMEHAVEKAITFLAGSEEQPLRERTRDFYERWVKGHYRPGARVVLEEHRSVGDQLVLLTASSLYLSELVADELGLDDVLCNRLEVGHDGRHTGRTIGSVCFGQGKLWHAQQYAEAQGTSLADCSFYTDSYSDLPVLEVVGNPVAVNPDARLRREAQRRRWPVVDWGMPAAGA